MYATGGERKVTNTNYAVANGGSITLDPKNNLIAIDHLDCTNGGLVYLGNTAGGEPIFKDSMNGEIRVGLIEVSDSCGGPIEVNQNTYSSGQTDVNCMKGSIDFHLVI